MPIPPSELSPESPAIKYSHYEFNCEKPLNDEFLYKVCAGDRFCISAGTSYETLCIAFHDYFNGKISKLDLIQALKEEAEHLNWHYTSFVYEDK